MKTEIKIPVRAYLVKIRDNRTGEKSVDTIVLTKEQIRAGAMFDLGDEDIIFRTYNRKGYRVEEIGKAEKVELTVDLHELYSKQTRMEQLLAWGEAHSDARPDNKEAEACDAE